MYLHRDIETNELLGRKIRELFGIKLTKIETNVEGSNIDLKIFHCWQHRDLSIYCTTDDENEEMFHVEERVPEGTPHPRIDWADWADGCGEDENEPLITGVQTNDSFDAVYLFVSRIKERYYNQ